MLQVNNSYSRPARGRMDQHLPIPPPPPHTPPLSFLAHTHSPLLPLTWTLSYPNKYTPPAYCAVECRGYNPQQLPSHTSLLGYAQISQFKHMQGLPSPQKSNAMSKAGQCRTNQWPAVPDWPCFRNSDAGLTLLTTGKNADAELTFSQHSAIPALRSHGFPPCLSAQLQEYVKGVETFNK
jgi:hypothetical protein